MKSKFLTYILLVTLASLLSTVSAFSGSGAGSTEDPYLITSCTQLQEVSDSLASSYKLSNNIDCSDTINWNSGSGWASIGSTSPYFTGTFDGQGYEISNLFIDRSSTDSVGLFSRAYGANISNTNLVDVSIIANRYVGAMVGIIGSSTLINNCSSSGFINGSFYETGGLIGYSSAIINNSYSSATVRQTSTGFSTGGLLGSSSGGTTLNSYSTGTVIGYQRAGGLIGTFSTSSLVDNCYSSANVTGENGMGGIIGHGYGGVVNNSYFTGTVYNSGSYTAGIIAFSQSNTMVENCYSTGNLTGNSAVGGINGYNEYADFFNCYSSGTITGSSGIGGIIGTAYGSDITRTYSTATVVGGSYAGGLVGRQYYGIYTNSYAIGAISGSSKGGVIGDEYYAGTETNLFWDTETTGVSTTDGDGTGKTTAEMKDVATYTETDTVGLTTPWDFQSNPNDDSADNDYWGINSLVNDGYPVLVGIGDGSGVLAPIATLNTPVDNYFISVTETIIFNCSISAYAGSQNLSLYITDNSNENFALSQTTDTSGSSASAEWDIELSAGDYTWGCHGYDLLNASDWSLNRTIILDATVPTFTTFANQTIPTGNALSYTIEATDTGSGVDCFTVNDTTNFQLSCAGLLQNNTELAIGTYDLEITVNDSVGNEISSEMYVEITPTPTISLEMISSASNMNVTQNETFTVSATVTCSDANCGEINVSLDPIDRTPRTCSEVWGASCVGSDPLTSDYSFDGCSAGSYYSSGFWVDEVTVDATTVAIGNTINITCNYDCYSSSSLNDLAISYYDGTWNQIWSQDASCIDGDYSVQVNVSGDIGEQWVRCQIGYEYYNPSGTCFSTTYSDNDDVNFTVIDSTKSGLVSTTLGDTPFYTTSDNPYTVTSLNEGESETITWTVNTTGEINSTHEFFVFANQTTDQSISDETIHWNVTIVNFTVDNTAPDVTLNTPANNTGDNDGTLLFNYSVSDTADIDNCSLILDNIINETNSSTITKDADLNFTITNINGRYNWNINCTDANGNIGASATRTLLVVLTTDFGGGEKPDNEGDEVDVESGDTTDLTQVDISNITNLIIDKPDYGKINFTDDVDLLSSSSSGLNLSEHITISSNRIEINSTALPALNKSAKLQIYNLTFTDPQILKDGELCSSEICTEESYSSGTLTFNVTQFSTYSARETPTTTGETITSASSSSSSGGGSTLIIECTQNSDCDEGYSCYNKKCVKLFDVEILDLKPSVDLLNFDLKYLIKGMADINNDVIIKFWIEDSGSKVELGQDTIYVGSFEEKTKTTSLTLPQDLENGVYDLYVQVSYENYDAQSFRKININLPVGVTLEPEEVFAPMPSSESKQIVFTLILATILISAIMFGYPYLKKEKADSAYKKRTSEQNRRAKELVNFIEQCISRGIPKERIKLALLKNRWQSNIVEDYVEYVWQNIVDGNKPNTSRWRFKRKKNIKLIQDKVYILK
jgi:hypothetical protein